MNSVPEPEAFEPYGPAQYAGHPAALEAAASLRSPALGARPQWGSLLPLPSRPARAPSHNARVRGFLRYRLSQLAHQGQQATVAEPERMAFRSLLGARHYAHSLDLNGYALNLEYAYQSPRGPIYVITGTANGFADGPLTGTGWARACTCPDFEKRRGPAREQLAGEARCCKHMRLFLAIVHLWQGQRPWVGCVPAAYLRAGEGFQLQAF